MGDISVIPLVDEGLGNSAYLLDLDDGRALAVDASRDLRALREVSEPPALRVACAADTHLHAVDLPNEPLVVLCGHSERAMGAASLLASAGHDNVTVLDGGPQDWADKSGRSLEVGQ